MKGKWYAVYMFTVAAVLLGVHVTGKTATVMAENRQPDRNVCLVIDPGHGGEDGGAVSVTGKPESAYNLEISIRLRDLLQLLGYEVKMTRESDISVYTKGETLAQKKASDLKQRVKLINETENAVLLSIHQNFFTQGQYSGPQVFYAGTEKSEILAKKLQELMVGQLQPGSNRKAKKCSGVYLMEHINCTGVLIECGFLSNYPEEAALRDPEYQKKVSSVIAVGVGEYLSNT